MPRKPRGGSKRAEQLRKQIAELQSPGESSAPEDDPAMKPGESPKEYVERRAREGGFKKASPPKPGPKSGPDRV
jgi:hypothetical protein